MIKILALFLLCFSVSYSQVYINGEKVSDNGSREISIVNGEVYVDGKSKNELKLSVLEEESKNIYRTKNVDAYNKWYNKVGKQMIEKRRKKKKAIIMGILAGIGTVLSLGIICFIIVTITRKLKSKSENKLNSSVNKLRSSSISLSKPLASKQIDTHSSTALPEISSPIKKK